MPAGSPLLSPANLACRRHRQRIVGFEREVAMAVSILDQAPSENHLPMIVTDSPVEFVLIGPHGEKPAVLARSAVASLELVGVSALSGEMPSPFDFTQKNFLGRVDDRKGRPILWVTFRLQPPADAADSRERFVTFAWVGMSSRSDYEEINKQLANRLSDLYRAISESNSQDLEWLLAPVILLCLRANARRVGEGDRSASDAAAPSGFSLVRCFGAFFQGLATPAAAFLLLTVAVSSTVALVTLLWSLKH